MKSLGKLVVFLIVVLFAGPAFPADQRTAPPIHVPAVFQSFYLKIFRSAGESWSSPYAVPAYHCKERTDLQEVFAGGPVLNPGDESYIRQYDPILSASVLCEGIDNNGTYIPRTDYETISPDSDRWNVNGLPLQIYGVRAYCEGDYSEPFYISAKEVILLCADHKFLPPD